MQPKVSVIVPVYNVEKYLDRCVQSIRNQTLRDIEIILVDDGSPDCCPSLCDEYARQDTRIKVIHKRNAGLGMACNSGMEVAEGEYIAFCDSDDWVDAEMYQAMYDVATKNSADAVYTGLKRVDGDGNILSYMPHPSKYKEYCHEEIYCLLCDMICAEPSKRHDHEIQVSAKVALYRKGLLDKNSISFVSERKYPSEDLIFNVSVLSVASVAIVMDRYYYNYFVNNLSITTTLKKDRFDKVVASAELLKEIIHRKDNFEKNVSHLARLSRFIIGEARSYGRLVVASDCGLSEKKHLIKSLSHHPALIKAIKNYPVNRMPFKHWLALKVLLSGNYSFVNLLLKL